MIAPDPMIIRRRRIRGFRRNSAAMDAESGFVNFPESDFSVEMRMFDRPVYTRRILTPDPPFMPYDRPF